MKIAPEIGRNETISPKVIFELDAVAIALLITSTAYTTVPINRYARTRAAGPPRKSTSEDPKKSPAPIDPPSYENGFKHHISLT